ncbi:hypothetical protein Vafri_6886 [Volvox africanus]|uniref:FAD-binding FR-type domain-containing protein n=1 Tax=Volvox africanus TaxID=51714 RepID=A0A8J4EZZ4_9CHLO|nr:hypothetical protein Vafri_6886 [Volvox africanus]
MPEHEKKTRENILERMLDHSAGVKISRFSTHRASLHGVQLNPYPLLKVPFLFCTLFILLSCVWSLWRGRTRAKAPGLPVIGRANLSSPRPASIWFAARCLYSVVRDPNAVWRAAKLQADSKDTNDSIMQQSIFRAKSLSFGTVAPGRAARQTQSISAGARLQAWNAVSTRVAASSAVAMIIPAGRRCSASSRTAAFSTVQPPKHTGRRSSVKVHANWGAPVEFKPARVVSNTSAAAGPLHKLLIDVGPLAAGYAVPGQFIQIKVGDSKPGFFAIASAPGTHSDGLLEFLIKGAPGTTAELLCNAGEGTEVSVSPVMGKGFPLDRLPASTTSAVLMFATGSGISPIRAVIDSGALAGRDLTLYYGTRNTDSTAYRELLPDWQNKGVKVVQVFSESKQGYVHDVFEREGLSKLPADSASAVGALLCGHKGMCQAITSLLSAKGVPPEKILLNF